jgi:hypothetical protein
VSAPCPGRLLPPGDTWGAPATRDPGSSRPGAGWTSASLLYSSVHSDDRHFRQRCNAFSTSTATDTCWRTSGPSRRSRLRSRGVCCSAGPAHDALLPTLPDREAPRPRPLGWSHAPGPPPGYRAARPDARVREGGRLITRRAACGRCGRLEQTSAAASPASDWPRDPVPDTTSTRPLGVPFRSPGDLFHEQFDGDRDEVLTGNQ